MMEMGTVLGWVLAPVCSALVGAVVAQARQLGSSQRAMQEGLKALLRQQIVNAYRDYVIEGRPLTVERKHELTEQYEAYAAIGGNGTGKAMYESICEVPITVVE